MVQFDRWAKLYLLISVKQEAVHAVKIKFYKIVHVRLFLMFKKARMIKRQLASAYAFRNRHMKYKRNPGMSKRTKATNFIRYKTFNITFLLFPWVINSSYSISSGVFHTDLTNRVAGDNQFH